MAHYYAEKHPTLQSSRHPIKQGVVMVLVFIAGYVTATLYDLASLQRWANNMWLAYSRVPQAPVVMKSPARLVKPKLEFYTLLTKNTAIPEPATKTNEPAQAIQTESHMPPSVVLSRPPVQEATPFQTAHEALVMSTEHYVVQIAAFNNLADANRMKAQFALKGFHVHVETAMHQRTEWHRVLLGPFKTKELAEAAMQAVSKQEGINGMLRKAAV